VLSLSIRCTNNVLKAGDEIPIEFIITNRGTNSYEYTDRTYDHSGRMREYKLEARIESGEMLPDPRAGYKGGWLGGGLFNESTLRPAQSFTRTIALNRWALVKDAGRYTVVGSYTISESGTNLTIIHSDPITVTVLPRTDVEMDAYIGGLSNQLAAIPSIRLVTSTRMPENKRVTDSMPNPAIGNLVLKLMYTCSPKIVPILLKTVYEPASEGFWESEALQFYVPHTETVKNAIIHAVMEHGLGSQGALAGVLRSYNPAADEMKPIIERLLAPDYESDWNQGAWLAREYWNDAFASPLIAIAGTPGSNGRVVAITTLAYNRTDEGVKALKDLLRHPAPDLCLYLGQALENAYYPGRSSTGRRLQPDDLTAEDVKPLIRELFASTNQIPDVVTAVTLEEQFGSDDFTDRLIAIATTPGSAAPNLAIYALALNRTDAGVKTLKQLLNDPSPSTRTTTEQAIRYAYTSRGTAQGRPLEPGDFPQFYANHN
jgi:hypothetical protein